MTRDDRDRAEEMYEKSLAIHEALGSKEGMAIQYGNLGILYQTRGDRVGDAGRSRWRPDHHNTNPSMERPALQLRHPRPPLSPQ